MGTPIDLSNIIPPIKRYKARGRVIYRVRVGGYQYDAKMMREAVVVRRRIALAAIEDRNMKGEQLMTKQITFAATVSAKELGSIGVQIITRTGGHDSGFYTTWRGVQHGPHDTPRQALIGFIRTLQEDIMDLEEAYEGNKKKSTDRQYVGVWCEGCSDTFLVDVTDGDEPPQNALCEDCQERLHGPTIGQ